MQVLKILISETFVFSPYLRTNFTEILTFPDIIRAFSGVFTHDSRIEVPRHKLSDSHL